MSDERQHEHDRELRERFSALRTADRARAPTFERVSARSHARLAPAWGVALLGVAALAAFVLPRRETAPLQPEALPPVMSELATEMPSDFLLSGRSADVRRDAPRLGPQADDEVPFL
jgi:hypothetical protein